MKPRPKSADPRMLTAESRAKSQLKKPIECELLKETYPAISDTDHMRGECYCHLCTCGEHKCPGDYKRTVISTRSHFSTSYKQMYKKHPGKTFIYKAPIVKKVVNFPLESVSTTHKDFTRPELIKTESYSPKYFGYNPLKFVAKTKYSSTFHSWSESFLEKQYVMEHPCHLPNSKFMSSTVYQDDFQNFSSKNVRENNVFANKLKEKARGCKGLISTFTEFLGKSTQKESFKKFDCEKPFKERGAGSLLSLGDFKTGYKSTYGSTFTNPVFIKTVKKKYAMSKAK